MKTLLISFRFLLALTLLTGIAYPLLVTVAGDLFFSKQAKGTLLSRGNEVVGSELIAQGFSRPEYFWPRPSAIKYDSASSGASNLSPSSLDLIKAVKEREAQGLVADMRFTSASGLDPHISVEAAKAQINRIITARNLGPAEKTRLNELLGQSLEPRQLGILGEERINVLRLNLSLDEAFKGVK